MAETYFDHGELPERVVGLLACPAWTTHAIPAPPDASIRVRPGSGYRALFACSACGLIFGISDAQLRKLARRLPS